MLVFDWFREVAKPNVYRQPSFSAKHQPEGCESCCVVHACSIGHHALWEVLVLSLLVFMCSDAEHSQECAVQAFYKAIRLGMVWGCSCLVDAQ